MAATAPEMTSDVYYWLIRYEAECGRKVSSCFHVSSGKSPSDDRSSLTLPSSPE